MKPSRLRIPRQNRKIVLDQLHYLDWFLNDRQPAWSSQTLKEDSCGLRRAQENHWFSCSKRERDLRSSARAFYSARYDNIAGEHVDGIARFAHSGEDRDIDIRTD